MTLYGGLGQLTRPGKAGAAGFTFQFVTTAGGQTATINRIKPTGGALVIAWGDGGTTTVAAGDATAKTHVYAAAGAYDVTFDQPSRITEINLQDTKIRANFNSNPMPTGLTSLVLYNLTGLNWTVGASAPMPTGLTYLTLQNLSGLSWTVGASAPMPTGLTYLYLNTLTGLNWTVGASAPMPTGLTYLILQNLSGLSWTVGASAPMPTGLTYLILQNLSGLSWTVGASAPMPTGLTYLYLYNLSGLSWIVGASAPMPTGLTYLYLYNLSGLSWQINASQPWPTGATACVVINSLSVTVSEWSNNAIRSIQLENAYSQANVDAVISAIYANRANFTYATPSLDLLGGSNSAPSGVYQAANPPTTGKEMLYSLVNDNLGEGFKKWTVQYQA